MTPHMPQTRRTFGTYAASVFTALLFSGCSAATIVTDIGAVVSIVTAAAPIIAIFAGPGAALITMYLIAVTTGLNCVLATAQMPGVTVGQITEAVASCLVAAVEPALPPDVPQEIITIVNAVAAAVLNFITKWGKGTATFNKGVEASTPLRLHKADYDKLHAMEVSLAAAQIQLQNHIK